MKLIVVGAGPAGVMAAMRAAELGAETTLVTRGEFGGMAANDGPVPVRTLAHAARLIRGARELARHGIAASEPRLDYGRLLARVRAVVAEVRDHSSMRAQAERLGVRIIEQAGDVRFAGAQVVESASGLRLEADRIILCIGGVPRRLEVPGAELVATASDAWSLTAVPASMLVVGGGLSGLQVASIFQAFGSHVTVFQRGPRILPDEDEDVAREVASQLRAAGITIRSGIGDVERFERTAAGVRMSYAGDGRRETAEAALVVATIGWTVNAASFDPAAAGVELDERGFVRVDEFLTTSTPHIFAAGDVTGRSVLAAPVVQDAHAAATNAVRGRRLALRHQPVPMSGFTEPEYARIGLTEAVAREHHDVAIGAVRFGEVAGTIIEGRTAGFCKLIVDRSTRALLGCHVVGDRAADIVQAVAIALRVGLTVDDLSAQSLAFPPYLGALSRAAYRAAAGLSPPIQ